MKRARPDESITAARHAVAIRDSLGRTRDMAYLGLLSNLAMALDGAGRWREAVAQYQHTIAAMDSSARGGTLTRSIMRHNLAVTLVELGETAEAELVFREVLERSARSDQTGRINWQPVIHYAETALTQGHADSSRKYFGMIVAQGVRDTSLYWEGRGLFGSRASERAARSSWRGPPAESAAGADHRDLSQGSEHRRPGAGRAGARRLARHGRGGRRRGEDCLPRRAQGERLLRGEKEEAAPPGGAPRGRIRPVTRPDRGGPSVGSGGARDCRGGLAHRLAERRRR